MGWGVGKQFFFKELLVRLKKIPFQPLYDVHRRYRHFSIFKKSLIVCEQTIV